MWKKLLIFIILLTAASCLVAWRGNRPTPLPNNSVAAMLAQPVEAFDCNHASLARAIELLQRQSGCRIIVQDTALQSQAAPITIHLHHVRVSSVLKGICLELGVEPRCLNCRERDGQLIVTTQADPAEKPVPQLYPVSDLIAAFTARENALTPEAAEKYSWCFSGSEPSPRNVAVDTLINMLEAGVEFGSWQDYGGSVGSAREVGGALLVIQTPENQKNVVRVLQRLRAAFRREEHTREGSASGCTGPDSSEYLGMTDLPTWDRP